MVTYNIKCPICNKGHIWFSNNTGDQRCLDCISKEMAPFRETGEKMETNMTLQEQLIDTLKSAIAAKDDLIDHLKKEVQRLQASQVIIKPSEPPAAPVGDQPLPTYPGMPYTPPYWPTNPPWYPNPLYPPYIVTSTSDTSKVTIGDLPGSSVQGTITINPSIYVGDPPGSCGHGGSTSNAVIAEGSLPPGSVQSAMGSTTYHVTPETGLNAYKEFSSEIESDHKNRIMEFKDTGANFNSGRLILDDIQKFNYVVSQSNSP